MLRMVRHRRECGTLLLEVLIATTVMSVGILACLRVLSGSIHASEHVIQMAQFDGLLDQALFPYFLDPTTVDLETGAKTLDRNEKSPLLAKLQVESMSKNEESEADEKDKDKNKGKDKNKQVVNKIKTIQQINQEFFAVTFLAERFKTHKSAGEFNAFLFRYGQKEKTKKP